jgi:hypothetical protein
MIDRYAHSPNSHVASELLGSPGMSTLCAMQPSIQTYLVSQEACWIITGALQKLRTDSHFIRIVNKRAFAITLVAFAKPCIKLTECLFLGTAEACIVETPPNLFTGKCTSCCLGIPHKLIPTSNTDIPAGGRFTLCLFTSIQLTPWWLFAKEEEWETENLIAQGGQQRTIVGILENLPSSQS